MTTTKQIRVMPIRDGKKTVAFDVVAYDVSLETIGGVDMVFAAMGAPKTVIRRLPVVDGVKATKAAAEAFAKQYAADIGGCT